MQTEDVSQDLAAGISVQMARSHVLDGARLDPLPDPTPPLPGPPEPMPDPSLPLPPVPEPLPEPEPEPPVDRAVVLLRWAELPRVAWRHAA